MTACLKKRKKNSAESFSVKFLEQLLCKEKKKKDLDKKKGIDQVNMLTQKDRMTKRQKDKMTEIRKDGKEKDRKEKDRKEKDRKEK